MTEDHPFVAELAGAARTAELAEAEFRATMKDRVAELARERAFAFRRMNVMRSLMETVGQAETREIAIAAAVTALRLRLGWREDSPARDEVLVEYAKLADAAFRETHPGGDGAKPAEDEAAGRVVLASAGAELEPKPDLDASLRTFEAWYAATREKPFWVLFEHYMPETQLVDF